MNDLRTDLSYLLRQLQSAADPKVMPGAPAAPQKVPPEVFLETLLQIARAQEASEAERQQLKTDLKAINDELPRWWALLDDDETPAPSADAAE